jgi:hypothetical protein
MVISKIYKIHIDLYILNFKIKKKNLLKKIFFLKYKE